MPEAKPINWVTHPADSFPVPQSVKINFEQLPAVPFRVNAFRPLKTPVTEMGFDLNNLDKISLNLGAIKPFKLSLTKFLLPKPVVTVANIPSLSDKGNSGILKLAQAEGLIGNNVYAMVTDPQGNVWLSTERGLVKYTGNEFYNYNFFDRSDITGTQERGYDLLIDKQGRLLLITRTTGLYRIDLKTNVVENYRLRKGGGYRIAFDSAGVLWGNGPGWIDLEKENLYPISMWMKYPDLGLQETFGLYVDRSDNVWVGFKDKIGIIDPSRKAIRFIGRKEGLNTAYPFDFMEDRSGKVWISDIGNQGASFISLKEQKIGTLSAKQGYFGGVRASYTDKSNRVWMVSEDSVSVYDPKASRIKSMYTGGKIFKKADIVSGARDTEGKIWIGTEGDGALLIDPEGMMNEYFSSKDGLSSDDIWGIREDSKGRVLMATYTGVNIYDPAKEKLSFLKFPPQISANTNRSIEKIGTDVFFLGTIGGFAIIDLPANTMTFYNTQKAGIGGLTFTGLRRADGKVWAVSDKGLLVFDLFNKTVKQLDKAHGLTSDVAYLIKEDKQGRVWIVTDMGLNLIDPSANTIRKINETNGLASSYTSMLFQALDGTIFVGADKGLSVLDPALKTITNISAEQGLSQSSIYDIGEVQGRIQLATDNGLVVVERPAKKDLPWHFYTYSKSAGFPYNDYNQASATSLTNGQVWWAAAPILTVVHQDPVIDTIKPRVHIKGLSIMDQNPSFLKKTIIGANLANGDTLQIGNKKYAKDKLPDDSGYLTDHHIQWDDVTTGYNLPVGLKLPYDQNVFSISFINPSVVARNKIVYKYILEGAEKEWSETGPKTSSRIYYNLGAGNYTFKVITKGFNEQWSDPATFKFTILPPWWQTWWAWALYILAFSGVIYIIVKMRSTMLERENKLLEEKVQVRTQQLEKTINELTSTQSQLIHSEKMASLGELTAGIAHEIQNPLNFVNNFSEVSVELLGELKEELSKESEADPGLREELIHDISQNLDKINHHGKRADAIVKGMLQHSRAGSNQKEAVDINTLCDEYLRLSYHGLRAKDKSFNAAFKSDFDESIGKVNIVPQDIGRVIMNLLTNAFYAVNERKTLNPAGSDGRPYEPAVYISTRKRENGVEIKVGDNGTGIPPAIAEKIFQPFFTTKPTGKGTGLGLSMSYDIVTKGHGGTLSVRSKAGDENEDTGTEFTIFIPSN